MTRRVVVTGVGAVTAVGHTAEDTWQRNARRRERIDPITLFDPEPYPVRIQAEVKNFSLGDRADAKQQRYMNRGVTFGVAAALEALADSKLEITDENADMVGVIFSAGGGGTDLMVEYQHCSKRRARAGSRRSSSRTSSRMRPAAISPSRPARAARTWRLLAPARLAAARSARRSRPSAAATPTAIIAGSSEAVLLPLYHATWCSMRALPGDNEHPEKALKPFDLNRDGFIAGEGGAAMIIEDLRPRPSARGAQIYCEIIGYGSSNDAYDMIALHETGRGLKRAVNAAMRKAAIDPADDRLHQPPRQRHAAERPRGDGGVQGDHGQGRLRRGDQLGEADHRVTAWAPPARWRRSRASWRSATSKCRRRSTTPRPTRSATSIMSRTSPARRPCARP